MAALIHLARCGEDGTLILAFRALAARFGTAWFSKDDAAQVVSLEWLGDRPNLWAELHALGYLHPRTGSALWRLNLNGVLSTQWIKESNSDKGCS